MTAMEKMIEEFQCPGCVCGGDLECGSYEFDKKYRRCARHVIGTLFGVNNPVAIGLPKGFNKPGYNIVGGTPEYVGRNKLHIRFWGEGSKPDWNHLNVPVWALEKGAYLFVRTYSPRINDGVVDVILGGTMELVPNAIDVAEFIDEID